MNLRVYSSLVSSSIFSVSMNMLLLNVMFLKCMYSWLQFHKQEIGLHIDNTQPWKSDEAQLYWSSSRSLVFGIKYLPVFWDGHCPLEYIPIFTNMYSYSWIQVFVNTSGRSKEYSILLLPFISVWEYQYSWFMYSGILLLVYSWRYSWVGHIHVHALLCNTIEGWGIQ